MDEQMMDWTYDSMCFACGEQNPIGLHLKFERVDEETVRLHSHLSQLRDMLQGDEPVGRKLDFLIQEINRECNTIGSKCSDLTITQDVVNMKAEVEKIREQVQNIE